MEHDPSAYDLIVIGTPVWSYTYAPPVRTFLESADLSGKQAALFCCHGGDPKNTLAHMANALPGCEIIGTIDFFDPAKHASERIETFSPAIFAEYCSRNGLTCLKRLAQYKPLIGALLYKVTENESEVCVEVVSADAELELPEILVGIEFVFLVGLLRKATKENIQPVQATAKQKMHNLSYAEFLGVGITSAEKNQLIFAKAELLLPFISCNESMWEFFEPELNKRLSMMETNDSYAARVRSALMELLPRGECAIEDVAKKLGYSKRSLQRKLQEENTNFQKQLNHTRELLAKYYVGSTDMRAEDIAYLLGYQEVSSFLRAFSIWTGTTISGYRQRK